MKETEWELVCLGHYSNIRLKYVFAGIAKTTELLKTSQMQYAGINPLKPSGNYMHTRL
jgi:hypothetical protein